MIHVSCCYSPESQSLSILSSAPDAEEGIEMGRTRLAGAGTGLPSSFLRTLSMAPEQPEQLMLTLNL